MKKLLGLTLAQLGDVAAEIGLRPFAARQMAVWLYQKRVSDIDAMTDLPKRARAALVEKGYAVGREEPLAEARSSDGTVKYLFAGRGGRDVRRCTFPIRSAPHSVSRRRQAAAWAAASA